MANPYSVLGMMQKGGGQAASAPIPTVTYGAQNILGTAVPQVGDNKGHPNYAGKAGGVDAKHVVLISIAFIALGYLVYHFNFEK